MYTKDADGMTHTIDSDRTASSGALVLAYPTGISVNPTGDRKCLCKTTLVHGVRMMILTFLRHFSHFSAKHFDANVLEMSRSEQSPESRNFQTASHNHKKILIVLTVCLDLSVQQVRINMVRQIMRLWYFLSSVNSFFKRACATIQWS